MMLRSILCLLLVLVVSGREAIELNLHNYAEAQHIHRPLLVLFHKDNKQNLRFLDEFKKIAADHDAIDQSLTLGVVDADTQQELIDKHHITKFPTSFMFLGEHEKYEYQSYWITEHFVKWPIKQYPCISIVDPYSPAVHITSYDQLVRKFELFQVTVMLYIDLKDVDCLQVYSNAAKQIPDVHNLDDIKFYFTYFDDEQIAKLFNLTQHSLYIHTSVEDRATYVKTWEHNNYLIHYEGDMKHEQEIVVFLKIHNKKRFFYVDYYKYGSLVKRDDNYVTMFFVYNSTIPGHEEYALDLRRHKRWAFRKTYIGLLDVVKDGSSRARHDFSFQYPDHVPTLVGVKSKGDGVNYWKFKCNQDPWEHESIKECYDDIVNDRIPKFIRNQIFTEDQKYGERGVRNLNSTTFWDYIAENNEQGRDVLIMFHMVGCKQCEEFQPIFNNVIDIVNGEDGNSEKLIFAQIDWQLNELENTGVDKFPYLRLYPAYKSKSVDSLNHKNEDQILAFLKHNCYNGLAGLVEFDL